MLERRSGGQWSVIGGGGVWKERRMRGRRGGQALADGRLSGIDRRCWLGVLREKARRLCGRRSSSRGGVLKRMIDRRSPPSSRWVLVDLGVGWGSHRTQHMHVREKTRSTVACYTIIMQQTDSVAINSYSTVHANVLTGLIHEM